MDASITLLLISKEAELINADPTWDKVGIENNIRFHEQLVADFWEEITNINPFNFIADGDNFIFISKDENEVVSLQKKPCEYRFSPGNHFPE